MSKKSMNAFQELMYRQQERKNNNDIFKIMLTISMYTLHDRYGFGNKRLERYMDHVNETLDFINDGYITMNDICEVLRDECEIEVQNRHRITPFKEKK